MSIQKECVELDDDVRWLVALISDTGMRWQKLQAVGVDIKLDADVPHVVLRNILGVHSRRSERDIPLAGTSL